MASDNALWGEERIANELLLKLGIRISPRTVRKYMPERPPRRPRGDYVMDTFPIVRKNDEKAHGEYRTKRVILEIYDAMAEAARTGKPYQSRLDPPPADPRVAHPDTRPAAEKKGAR